MKKISIIFLISLSFLLSSCFKKEEIKVTENSKTNLQDASSQLNNSSGELNKQEIGKGKIDIKNENNDILKKYNVKEEIEKEIKNNIEYTKISNGKSKIAPAIISKNIQKEEIILDNNTKITDRFTQSIYYISNNNVYYDYYGIEKIEGVSVENFKVLLPKGFTGVSVFGINGNSLYYKGKKIENGDIKTLKFFESPKGEGASGENYLFAGDKNNLYLGEGIFKGGDVETLQGLGGYYWKDKNHVYISGGSVIKIIEGANSSSFEVIGSGYSKDKNKIYYAGIKIEGVDVNSYKYLGLGYLSSKDKIYYLGEKIEGVDIKSFEILGEGFSRDGINIYYKSVKQDGVQDINTFSIINNTPQDNICIYKIINESLSIICNEKKQKNLSGTTDEISDEETNKVELIDASVSEETELLSAEEKEFMKNEVDEVDTETFVRFKNSIYSKDKNNVYFLIYGLNKLIGVDPKNFKVLQPDGYYWTDGKNIFMMEKKIEDMDLASLKFIQITDKFIVGGDKNNLYIGSRLVIKGGDINSLVYLSENCLKDNLHIYCSFADFGATKEGDSYDIVEGVDNDTFEPIDYFYAKDKDSIYFEGEKIEGADITSFKVFKNSLFAKDITNAYYEGLPIEGIKDINSFTAINGIPQDKDCFYKIDNTDNSVICEKEE